MSNILREGRPTIACIQMAFSLWLPANGEAYVMLLREDL